MPPILVKFKKEIPKAELEQMWNLLYSKARPNFFLSWNWIGNWLDSIKSPYTLCIASQNDSVVGLGILVDKKIFRNGFVRSKQLFLHKTGEEKTDQIWIEYNDFLLSATIENAVRTEIIEQVHKQLDWDEFVIGASTHNALIPFRTMNLNENLVWHSHSYQVNLTRLRNKKLDYLSTLSKNSRYQINRSLKAYRKRGEISLSVAKTVKEGLCWFEEAAPFHISRWENTIVGSGFSNPTFVKFHQNLIKKNLESGSIDIIKITAGDSVICYLYNFIQGNDVKFYLSANNYEETGSALKPGLVAHYLAIQHYINKGFELYDFMAGESQYKRSLASTASPIFLCVFSKKKLKFTLENKLRELKQRHVSGKKNISKTPTVKFILTGGKESNQSNSPQYIAASIVACEVSSKGELKLVKTVNYQPPSGLQNESSNVLYKSGSINDDTLNVVTETEIHQYQLPELELKKQYSHQSFNDLHHVVEKGDDLFVVNTGLDCVTQFSALSGDVNHFSALTKNKSCRLNEDVDYRQVQSTKPHLAHPNYAFFLNDNLWATRCDFMDAICLDAPEQRINIGHDLVHDGVVYKDNIFFTNVDGRISVYDTKSLSLKSVSNLNHFIPNLNGWCRGVLPVSTNLVLVGISKIRQSKKHIVKSKSYARVILIDIHKHKKVWELNTSAIGIDAIFSILPGDKI
ncbi:GNAT family N-acetyltransferase [Glaciecola sp. MF2-115]|uniref:GNAT family N-acetyltransferase n=1 Tax=Glaciecola sp. MF2-115 TaxID=3384827 RepID=UPI0039A1B22F